MKFSTLQSVLGEELDAVFSGAAKLGFDGVELDWRDPADAQTGALNPELRPAIRQRATEAGIQISGVAAHFLNGGGLADAEKEEFGFDSVRAGLQLCRDLGAGALLVPFFGPGEIRGDEAKLRLIENLRKLAPEALESLRGDEAARLLDEINSPAVGDYFDMANCLSLGFDPLQEIEFLGRHIVRVHAKEFSGAQTGQNPGAYPGLNQVAFGAGKVPVREVLSQLKAIGYDGWITLETGVFGEPRESARAALAVLKRNL